MQTFGVVRYQDRWIITASGRRWGQFLFRVDAEEAALRLVSRARSEGQDGEVLVQGALGDIYRLVE